MLYDDIECAFERIETYFQGTEISKNKKKGFCDHLKFLRKQYHLKLTENEKSFLIYCIDTMLEMLEEDNPQKIVQFANISKQVAQVYQKKRFFHSLSLDIKNFRWKWGKEYFKNYKEIYRKSVETDPRFMTKEEEKQYGEKTRSFAFVFAFIFLFTSLLYRFVVVEIAPNEWYIISGLFGLMFLQVGVLNFFVDKQIAMSKKTAWILIALGSIIFFPSMFFLFT